MTASLSDHWAALIDVGLLGAGRRPMPDAPAGPVAELAEARRAGDGGEAVLDQVGLLGALRRSGVRPGPAVPLLVSVPDDPRPVCSARAAALLLDVLSEWPVLLDEWFATLAAGGKRLAPELVVPLLGRFRSDPKRRAVVLEAAGPLGEWIAELFPEQLAPRKASARSGPEPHAPLPADFAALVALEPSVLAAALAEGLERTELSNRHRPMLVQLLCTVPAVTLPAVAAALNRAGTNPNTMGLALSLAELATIRHSMIQELLT